MTAHTHTMIVPGCYRCELNADEARDAQAQTEMPERIQLSRKRGWRKPENTVIVARPSKWGNPYRIEAEKIEGKKRYIVYGRWTDHSFGVFSTMKAARSTAVEMFALNVGPMGAYEYDRTKLDDLRAELAGKNLACWCPLDQPCHADVLLELANGSR